MAIANVSEGNLYLRYSKKCSLHYVMDTASLMRVAVSPRCHDPNLGPIQDLFPSLEITHACLEWYCLMGQGALWKEWPTDLSFTPPNQFPNLRRVIIFVIDAGCSNLFGKSIVSIPDSDDIRSPMVAAILSRPSVVGGWADLATKHNCPTDRILGLHLLEPITP